ncbi:MAG: hypothetical protein L0Z62_31610 [Gemmataceae bacterium]|nr:hypothetical protein [Gemmataceae bacterium]
MFTRVSYFLGLFGLLGFVPGATADPPRVTKVQGHVSPLIVEVTRADGTMHKGMLVRVITAEGWNSHQYHGVGSSQSRVTVWLDTIQSIRAIEDEEARFVLKGGGQQVLKHSGTPRLVLRQESDTEEVISLTQLKEVRFLKPARKDGAGNAMFDHWKHSPYTGEKLAKD